MRIVILIGMVLAGSWVNAQTFELTKDSALIGEKVQLSWIPDVSMDTSSHYWWKRVEMNADNDSIIAKADMEWVKGQNEDEGDTLWIESRNSGKVYFRFFEGGSFELTNGKKEVASIFIKAPPMKEGDIEDIRDIEEIPVVKDYIGWLIWLGMLLLLFLIGYFIYHKILKRKNKTALENDMPITALTITERLEAIQKQSGHSDMMQWATDELSLTMRLFCASRYQIAATEMTSEELIQRLEKCDLSSEARATISKVLAYTDRIKFAKALPEWSIIDQLCEEVKQMEIAFTK